MNVCYVNHANVCVKYQFQLIHNQAPSIRIRIFFKPDIFFIRFGLASTRKRLFRQPKTEVFENAPQSEVFRKRRFRVYV